MLPDSQALLQADAFAIEEAGTEKSMEVTSSLRSSRVVVVRPFLDVKSVDKVTTVVLEVQR